MISIALATFNGEKFLSEQLDSLINQSYKDIEIIVCDDCSTDNTFQILADYAKKDSRIKIFKNAENLGFKKNFEKAISLCSGEFIALSDQDDIWNLNKLERELAVIGNADFVFSDSEFVDMSGNSLNQTCWKHNRVAGVPKNMNKFFTRLTKGNIVQGSTMLAKSDFLKSCLPIPNELVYHDFWFAINATIQNGIVSIPECLMKYRIHSAQVTKNQRQNNLSKYPFWIKPLSWYDEIYKDSNDHLEFLSQLEQAPLDKTKAKIVHHVKMFYRHRKYNFTDFYMLRCFLAYPQIIPLDRETKKEKIKFLFKTILSTIRWTLFRPYLRHLQRKYFFDF